MIFLAADFGGGFGSVKYSVANPYGPAAGNIDMNGYYIHDTVGDLTWQLDSTDMYILNDDSLGVKLNLFTVAPGSPATMYMTNEAGGTLYLTLTGFFSADGGIKMFSNKQLSWGNSFNTKSSWQTQPDPDNFIFALSNATKTVIFTEVEDLAYAFTVPAKSNPTIHIHSSDKVDANDWIEFSFDQTNGIIDVGQGNIELKDPLQVPSYTVDQHVVAGSAVLGPSAPSRYVNGSVSGIGFASDGESAYIAWEVPDCWVGAENIALKVYWTNQSGDALLDTETVKWDFEYRVLAFGTDTTTTGTAATATSTYTQSGAGTDGDTHVNALTLVYNDANQPLVAGEVVTGRFDRDVAGDTYSGAGVVPLWEFSLSADGICDHF
jgi:hypothetical protein